MVEEGLDDVEVRCLASADAFVSVEEDLCVDERVVSGVRVGASSVVGEVDPAIRSAHDVGVGLDDPDEFLGRMTEVELLADGRVGI